MRLKADDIQTLRSLEETLWCAKTRYDPAQMDQIFAEDMTEIGRSGRRYGRLDLLFSHDPDAIIDATLPLPDYSVELIAKGVVLATYNSEVRCGNEIQRARRSSIWVRLEGCWKLRFHQGTPY